MYVIVFPVRGFPPLHIRLLLAYGALLFTATLALQLAGTLNPWPSPYLGNATPWANTVEEAQRPHFGRYLWR